ncbi:MAG: hypothetical protein QXI60_01590, partial [Thermofilaceae archaeon]
MPFTIEWPLLAREETPPSASSYPASRQFNNTATFFYDAAEWDGIESIRLEVVARGRRGVQVTFNYQSRADNQYDTAEAILSGTGFAPEGQTVTHILSATTTSQGGVQVTFYHVWELTNNGTNVTCTLTLSSYVSWGGTPYYHESAYTVTVPVGGSAGTSFTIVRNTEPTVVVEVGGTISSTATQPCKFALCPVSSTTPVVELEFHTNSPQRQVSGNISLTSGTEYVLKAINGDPNAVVYGARLLIKQSSAAAKTIVPYEIGVYFQTPGVYYMDISPLAYYLHRTSD